VELDPRVKVGDALERLGARPPHHSVNLVALGEEEFGQV
jgi:hypothetical protein